MIVVVHPLVYGGGATRRVRTGNLLNTKQRKEVDRPGTQQIKTKTSPTRAVLQTPAGRGIALGETKPAGLAWEIFDKMLSAVKTAERPKPAAENVPQRGEQLKQFAVTELTHQSVSIMVRSGLASITFSRSLRAAERCVIL